MRPEDVPAKWVKTARAAHLNTYAGGGSPLESMAAALAAVAPRIAAAERERIAAWHDEQAAGEDAMAKLALGADDAAYMTHRVLAREHLHSAAAIRARSTEDTTP